MRQLQMQDVAPIDLVLVNFYPFERVVARPDCTLAQAIEMIDVGGPCLCVRQPRTTGMCFPHGSA